MPRLLWPAPLNRAGTDPVREPVGGLVDTNLIFPALPTYTGVPSLGGFLSLLVVLVLPVLAGLFMRTHWSTPAKGLVLVGCAAVKAFLEAWIVAANANTHFDVGAAAWSTAVQFALAVVAYFGLVRGMAVQRAALQGGIIRSNRVVDGEAT
jgi:hypothetical protein